ncbi:cyclin-dependent kinase-activating kinase assembly factor-related / CDK-activating kinase assembly factor-like protein [Tasmannia lanceolata]|uniref:cyclin-dependent kinase-activating kinase assembly factor-related / CDK-activating kinase assembly factor-like protein n=1 Tax=Tasmannia lanceolata TaxID=3420 RepID=UPI004062D30E
MGVASGANPYAKEMSIRKRIGNIYNKREEDFPSLKEYNDYLEEVEDMVFNLIEGIDVAAIEAKIKIYEKENAEQIINAQARKAEDLAAALKASKGKPEQIDSIDGAVGQSSQAGVGGGQGQYAPAIAGGAFTQPRPTGIVPQAQPVPVGGVFDMMGYAPEDEEAQKLRAERGGRAGGWTVNLSRKRALEEAFGSMWV